jgi:hypothetical protein
MSFIGNNENFIRIKFYSGMRGLSLPDRIAYYNKNLKADTLERLHNYFRPQQKVSNAQSYSDLFAKSEQDTSQKKKDYEEILELLKEFEFDTIIKSIYYEDNSDELFYHLKDIIIKSAPENYVDEYGILSFVRKPGGGQAKVNVSDFIFSLFSSNLEINLNDWNSEDKVRHQTIYKLCDWLDKKLKEEQSEQEIVCMLFHYSKYWNIYFARSNDDAKRIFLLNRLSGLIETKGHDFVININDVLRQLESEMKKILCEYFLPPFLVTKEYLTRNNIQFTTGYENQLNRFENARSETNNYFRNFSNISFKQLIEEYFVSQRDSQKHLSSQVFKKMDKGEVPSLEDLTCFRDLRKVAVDRFLDSQNFISLFSKRNYMFDILKLE